MTARDGMEEEGGSSRSDSRDVVSGEVAREVVGQGVKQVRAPSGFPM